MSFVATNARQPPASARTRSTNNARPPLPSTPAAAQTPASPAAACLPTRRTPAPSRPKARSCCVTSCRSRSPSPSTPRFASATAACARPATSWTGSAARWVGGSGGRVGGWVGGWGGGGGGRWGGDGWSTLLWIYFVWLGAGSKDACGLGLAGGALPAAATAALSPPFNPAPRPLRCFSCRGLQAEQMLRDFDEAYKELEQQLPDPCRDTGARVCMAACRSRRSSSACQAAGHTCRPGLACPALHPAHTASPSPLPRPPTPHPHTPHPTPHTPSADVRCPQWAKAGECEKNQGFMFDSCMLSCNVSWGTAQHSVQAVGDLRGAACVRTRPCHPSPPAPACACVPCLSASHLADRPPPPSPPPAPAAAALRAPGRAGCHRRSSWGRCRRTGRRHDWRRSKGQCGASRHRSTAAC